MKLRCVSAYRADKVAFEPGQVVEDPRLVAHLLADSPASFEVVEDAPVVDRAVKAEAVTTKPIKATKK